MTYIPATGTRDLWAVLGGLVAIAIGVMAWVRRGDRDPSELDDAGAVDAAAPEAAAPDAAAPRGGRAAPEDGSQSGEAA